MFKKINFFRKKIYNYHDKLSVLKSDNFDINENYKYFKSPYEHIIIKSFFNNFSDLKENFPNKNEMSSPIRMHKDLTYPDKNYIDLIKKNIAYNQLHYWVYSKNFIIFFLNIFKKDILKRYNNNELLYNPFDLKFSPQPYELRGNIMSRKNLSEDLFIFPRIDIGLGLKDYGKINGGKGPHIDNLTRIISIMIYFTNQDDIKGGEFRMFNVDENYEYSLKKIINIKENLLLASLQSNSAFHDVNPLLDGERKAMYLSISCSKVIWNEIEDQKIKILSKNRI